MPDHGADVVVGLILLIVSAVFGLIVYAAKHWLKEEIERATYPIQKHANGGLSLPDVANAAKRTESKVDELLASVNALKGGFETHLVNHAK